MDSTRFFQFSGMWLKRRRLIDNPDDDYDGNPALIFATPPAIYACVAPSDPNNLFSDPVGQVYVTGEGFEPKTYKNIFTSYGLGRISFLLVDAFGVRKVVPLIENIYDEPEPFFEYPDGDYAGLLNDYHYGTITEVPASTTIIAASCSPPEEEKRCENHCIEIYRESDNAYICICKETEGPTLAPTQNRISKPKRPQPYTPSLDPPIKNAVIAQQRKSQKLAPQLKQAEERYRAKEAELLNNSTPDTLHEANRALIGWDKLRKEKEEVDAYVAANTTESERESGIIVDPSRPVYQPEIIPFPGGFTVKPYRNVPTKYRVEIEATKIEPTIVGAEYLDENNPRGLVHTNQQLIESEPSED